MSERAWAGSSARAEARIDPRERPCEPGSPQPERRDTLRSAMSRDFLSIDDLTPGELAYLLEQAA